MFRASNGKPVQWNGQTVILFDHMPVKSWQALRLIFEQFGSEWRQGVILGTKGEFVVNGKNCEKKVVFWQDTAPKQIDFEVFSSDGKVSVKNCWDTGDGAMRYGNNGAGIIVEEEGRKRRYRYNDGHPDDNLSDVVFTLEIPT